jgi:hypothetical protein
MQYLLFCQYCEISAFKPICDNICIKANICAFILHIGLLVNELYLLSKIFFTGAYALDYSHKME